jgi:GATA zinc finger
VKVQCSRATLLTVCSGILWQSLRQSRLAHLTSLYTIYSQPGQRNTTHYSRALPADFWGGIIPDARNTLAPLGEADVRIGPHVFLQTKFFQLLPPPVNKGKKRRKSGKSDVAKDAEGREPRLSIGTPEAQEASGMPNEQPGTQQASSTTHPEDAPRDTGDIDPELVELLNLRARSDPELSALLQSAAGPSVTTVELLRLSKIIARIQAELDEARARKKRSDASKTAAKAAAPGKILAAEETIPKARDMQTSTQADESVEDAAQQVEPTRPTLLFQFAENSSMCFAVPLWACLAERSKASPDEPHPQDLAQTDLGARPLKRKRRRETRILPRMDEPAAKQAITLSFLLPAIGSEIAGDSGVPKFAADEAPEEELAEDAASKQQGTTPNRAASEVEPETQIKKHEIHPVTWKIDATHSDALWQFFDKVPGCVDETSEEDLLGIKALARRFQETISGGPAYLKLPLLLKSTDVPKGLAEHLRDKFAPRTVVLSERPVAQVDVKQEEVDASFIEDTAATSEPRTKRLRPVATHNPDGSRKSCYACGTLKTPMWRKGPAGQQTLCNACGSKWIQGRLKCPEQPVAPRFEQLNEVEGDADISKEHDEAEQLPADKHRQAHSQAALSEPRASPIDLDMHTDDVDRSEKVRSSTSSPARTRSKLARNTHSPAYTRRSAQRTGASNSPFGFDRAGSPFYVPESPEAGDTS